MWEKRNEINLKFIEKYYAVLFRYVQEYIVKLQ